MPVCTLPDRVIIAHLPGLDSGEKRLVPRRLGAARLAAYNAYFMISGQLNFSLTLLSYQRTALRRCTSGRIRDSNERKPSPENESRVARAIGGARPEGVALLVCVITNGGHNEVCAVDSDHTTLYEP